MSTKAYQRGVTERIRRLVKKAGSQAAFARLVWGDPDPHKGKVNKWYNGTTGIRPDEAIAVAKAFDVRAAWLLLGELPEREGVTRTEAKLADDLAAYAAHEAMLAVGVDAVPSVRGLINGRNLLRHVVEVVTSDVRANMAHLRNKSETGLAILAIESAMRARKPVNSEGVLTILKRGFNTPPPLGTAIVWSEPDSFTWENAIEPILHRQSEPKLGLASATVRGVRSARRGRAQSR